MTRLNREVLDPIVAAVVEKQISRSSYGIIKYGTLLTRTDLTALDWINHAQEEGMDQINYLERLKQEITSIQEHLGKGIGEPDTIELVREFIRVFDMEDSDPVLWMNLIVEEFKETLQAWGVDVEVITSPSSREFNATEVLDGIVDLCWVTMGLGLVLKHNVRGAFKEVHRSNMSKVWPDGKAHKREDGKVLKGVNYSPPVLKPFLGTLNEPEGEINGTT